MKEQVLNQVDTVPVRGRSRKFKWDTETLKCYIYKYHYYL